MKLLLSVIALVLLLVGCTQSTSMSMTDDTAAAPLARLEAGNDRFISGRTIHPRVDGTHRIEVVENGQHPFAIIVSCADSRIPVERVFDQGVGDLFVMRMVGNVISDEACGSIEYGVDVLNAKLLVVMGHTSCGAVHAAIGGRRYTPAIDTLLARIEPAVQRAKRHGLRDSDLADRAIRENIWQSIADLMNRSAIVRDRVLRGELEVVGALYDLRSGDVEWLGKHPKQTQLASAE